MINADTPQLPPAGLPSQPQQPAQSLPNGLPSQPQQPAQTAPPAQTPAQPFVRVNADVFIAGEVAKQVRDGLESPLLRSLPAEMIEKIALERGGIDVAALNALDAVLRNRSLPLDASSPLTLERLEQWLRLALDNPKLAEDLADRVPLLGAREIIDKFLQLNKLGENFLPDNLLQKLSAERFFLGNGAGAGQNPALNAGNAPNYIFGNDLNYNTGVGINAGPNAVGNASGGVPENGLSPSAATIKELFAKAFSAAPAALLELVKRIDSSDINASGAKLPPEEARRIAGELLNRLPSQAAGKPELLHEMRQLPPRIAEAASPPFKEPSNVNTISNKTELPNACIIPNKAESSGAHIIQNKPESSTPIIANKADSSVTTIIQNKAELSNAHIIQNKPDSPVSIILNKADSPITTVIQNKQESPVSIIPNKTDSSVTTVIQNKAESPVSIIANKTDSPPPIIPNKADSSVTTVFPNKAEPLNAHIIQNRPEPPNVNIAPSRAELFNSNIIQNKPDSSTPIIPKGVDSSASIISNKTDSPAQTTQIPTSSLPKPPRDARHPVPQNVYDRIESSSRFNIPAESKNALFSQIGAAQEAIRSALDGSARASAVRQTVSNNINTDNIANKPTSQITQQATISDINRYTSQITQQANNPPASPPSTSTLPQSTSSTLQPQTAPPPSPQPISSQIAAIGEAVVKQAVSNDINTGNTANKPISMFTQQATIPENNRQIAQQTSNPPVSPPSTPTLPQSTPPTLQPQTAPSPSPKTISPQIAAIGEAVVKQAVSNDINTDNIANKPITQFTQQTSNPPVPPQLTSTLPQSTPSTLQPQTAPPQPTPQPVSPQITTTNVTTAGQAAPDIATQAARLLLDNTEKLRVGFQEAFSSLDLQSRVFPSDFSGGSESSAVRHCLDALRLETLLNASKALQDIFSIVEELRGAAEILSGKSREPSEVEKLLARAAENLARQARQSGGEIADRLSDALRELNRMQSDASKSDGGLPARQSPAEIMRSAALTAAGGLESLHLLASATRGQELQQQVVALPVKIGEEWTELQVKIIKERKGKKEKREGGGHVSVYLNAAPSRLGEVTAHLDYRPPASLRLSFQFGKPEATKWFRERAAGLREALSAAGLPGAALEFHTKPRPARAQTAENQEVTPVGAATVDGLGRVDFRV